MEKDTPETTNIDSILDSLLQGIHRSRKIKLIQSYSLEGEEKSHQESLNRLLESLKGREISVQDSYEVLLLLKRVLQPINASNVKWESVIDTLSSFILKQKAYDFLYADRSSLDYAIFDILRKVPEETLKSKLESDKSFTTFHMISKFYAKEQSKATKLIQFKALIVSRLKEEFLVDKSKHQVRMTPYFSSVLDDSVVEDLINSALKLFKRSESNFDTLVVLLEKISYDLSKWANMLILDNLKDYIVAKEEDKINKGKRATKPILEKSKDAVALGQILDGLIKLLQNNNQEALKAAVINHLFFFAALDFKEQRKVWLQKILGAIVSSLGMITTEDLYNNILQELDKISSLSFEGFTLDEKDFANLKKILTNPAPNKNSFLAASIVLHCLMKWNQDWPADYGTIIETMYTNHVTANLKAIGKLVTNYAPFIQTINLSCIYLKQKESAKFKTFKADLASMIHEESFLNMQKFYNKISQNDIRSWIRTLSLAIPTLESAISVGDSKFNILSSTLTETLIHPLLRVSDADYFLRSVECKDFVYTAILTGFVNKLYINDEKELANVNFDKMRIVCTHIIKDLNGVQDLDANFLNKLLFIIHCERISPSLKLQMLFKTVLAKDSQLKERFDSKLEENYDAIKTFLFSKDFLFSKKNFISQAGVNAATYLIANGYPQLLDETKLFTKVDNYNDPAEIEEFEENTKKSDFETDLTIYCGTLNKLGLTETKLQPEETKSSEKSQSKGAGKTVAKGKQETSKKTGKDQGKKMDQEELHKLRQEALKNKMIGYLQIITKIYKSLMKTKNLSLLNEYFSRCHQQLIELVQEEQARGPIEETLYCLFVNSPYKLIQRSSDSLIKVYFAKICELDNRVDDAWEEKLIKSLKLLRDLEFGKLDKNYSNLIYEICQHILVSENFEAKLKGHALTLIIKIGTTGDSGDLGEEILQMMIDNLDSISHYQETQSLFSFLLKKSGEKVFDSLFSYLLDYIDDAKVICLEGIKSIEGLDVIQDFERYAKIVILKFDENEKIVKLAEELLSRTKFVPSKQSFDNFDLKNFVNSENHDSIEKFCRSTPELLAKMPDAANLLIEKSIDAAESLAQNKNIENVEESLQFLPNLVQHNIAHIKDFLPKIFEIFIETYCVDTFPTLMEKTIEVGINIIKTHGTQKGDFILSTLEKYLDKKYPPQNNVTAIIYMGACAPYLKDKSKVKTICDKILNMAHTSTENLQKNLAKCLPDLIVFFNDPLSIAEDLLKTLQTSTDINKIRGSAYLLAGFVKGLGIKYLEKMKIMDFIEQNMDNKKDVNRKQAIIALSQALIENLGKIFEPYFIKTLQALMNFFGDQVEEIRLSSLKCTKTMMAYLSAYGVKQVLPLLLKGIEEKTWRAKVAAISVLGNMAFCAPKQLSSCLPQIVPKLAQALSDPHPTVQERGNQALSEIGSTIKNPEISNISDILIKALSNPYEENKRGLEVLLKTEFVHYIDTAALSLIIPIIEYGLRNRDSTLRKYASQLVGSISNLIKNPADLEPYLEMLINALKMAVCDTIADVRAIAARAYGALCKKLDFQNAAKLIYSIKEILENGESTSIDRAGAAQAMGEITYALGIPYVEKVLPVYLANTKSTQMHIRESYIGIFAFLPTIMDEEFEPYIPEVVDNIIESVSEDNETIRNLALRVCKILIQRFGLKKTSVLLEPAEEGLFSDNWRKRSSSIMLMSEMLEVLQRSERLSSENPAEKEEYHNMFNRIITSIYVLKFDNIEYVKNIANQIWKTFVDNTPKTLRLILYMLLDKLLYLINEMEENVDIAINCIHEFSSKYGESMYKDIIAFLENKKQENSEDYQIIKALCVMLDNIIHTIPDEFVESRKDSIIYLIQDLLITPDDYVRASACKVLETMIRKCKRSNLIQEIIPNTLSELEKLTEDSPEYDNYLKLFDEIIGLELDGHLEYLGKFLFQAPLTQYKMDIITNNAEVFGPELYHENIFLKSMEFLINELLYGAYDEPMKQSILYCINQLSINLDEKKIGQFLINCYGLVETINLKDNIEKIYRGLEIMSYYFHNTPHNFFEHIFQILSNINSYLTSEDKKILEYVNNIMNSILNSLEQEQSFEVIKVLNQSIEDVLRVGTKREIRYVNAFSIQDGLDPYINIMVKCLVFGPIDVFEQALQTYEHILNHTKKEALQEYVLKLVGPLLRVSFYKYENELKARIVGVLLSFESKGLSLSVFLPQLQTTFIKMISDYIGEISFLETVVRGLNYVIKNSKKRDYVLNELVNKYRTEETDEKKFAYLYCIYQVLKSNLTLFSKAVVEKAASRIEETKDFALSDIKSKYFGRVLGLMISLETVNKQKDIIKAFLARLENPSDQSYPLLARFMGYLNFCDPKVLEEFNLDDLERVISIFMKGIKAKTNILHALQDVKKLRKSQVKLRHELGQRLLTKNNFWEIYGNYVKDEEVVELLQRLS